MANEVRIKLTDSQRSKIKKATGKDMTELRVSSVGSNPAVTGSKKAISARAGLSAASARTARAGLSAASARTARAGLSAASARTARALGSDSATTARTMRYGENDV